jgi:MoaA/NifB/PqqE/SkfB family radical SAM enzyme
MTPEEVKQNIDSIFKIICFEDLAVMSSNVYNLYRVLNSHQKDSFEQNERLVFFSRVAPQQSLIKYLKQICDLCNISPSFVLLICPHDLQNLIDTVCGTEDKFTQILYDIDSNELEDGYKGFDTICPLPWMHLNVDNQGDIHPCCLNPTKLGSIMDEDPKDIFVGDELEKLRKNLQKGIRVESCNSCWKVEDGGGISSRREILAWHQHKFLDRLIEHPTIESLDIKCGNVCNFKCRSCNELSSSLIATENLKKDPSLSNTNRIKILQNKGRWFELNLNNTHDKILSLLDNVEQVDFYGGEPFLSRSLEPMLDYMIEMGRASKIRLHFNTNGSIFPKKIVKKLQQFYNVDIGISIDDIGQRFEIIRGGEWQEILQNIKLFQQLNHDQFTVHFFCTVSVLNVLYIDQLLDWANSSGMRILLNFVNNPEYLSIENLTVDAKQAVLKKYCNSLDCNLQVIVNKVKNSLGSDGKTFVQETKLLDLLRSQNFKTTHNEIATAMGL